MNLSRIGITISVEFVGRSPDWSMKVSSVFMNWFTMA